MTKKKEIELNTDSRIVFEWVNTHNLKNIDVTIPKNKLITITWVSGSGKSSLAFDTIYKEGQFRYIESLSSYLRQFFNMWARPEIEYCSGLSPAIAIEQNKRVWNSRSSVWTLTEIDDYLRLLFAKLGDSYCRSCGREIKPENVDNIMNEIKKSYMDQKIFILQETSVFQDREELLTFVKKNRNKVEKWKGFTRYLLVSKSVENHVPIEYFYLENPNVPENYFPIYSYGIYDRVTVQEDRLPRLKEDIVKILSEAKKFWVYLTDNWPKAGKIKKTKRKDEKKELDNVSIKRFTDKMFCPNCNITYPEFTPQHFSPNRPEWACEICHGIWEVLQVDFDKILDPMSPYKKAILPWRDSTFWQMLLLKLAQKYSVDEDKKWKDLPEWFQHVVLFWDNELLRVNVGWKYTSMYYRWIEEVIKDQYAKGILTVDFQAMLDMKPCAECDGRRLKKDSLNVFLEIKDGNIKPTKVKWKKSDDSIVNVEIKSKFNIADLQKKSLSELFEFLDNYQKITVKDKILVNRISTPLCDRVKTITDLWLWYLSLYRPIDTLSGWEIQRLRLAKQLWNKLTGIIYVLDEPTIWLDSREIKRAIEAIKRLREIWNTIIVVEHNDEFIKASDWIVEIWPGAGDFWWNVMFNWTYEDFLKSWTLTAQYITGKKKTKIDFEHKPSNNHIEIKKASKYNLKSIDAKIRLWTFTVITWPSGAGKTTLMYTTLYRFLNEKEKFIQSHIRLQLLKKWRDRQQILVAPVMQKDVYEHYQNIALQEFYSDLSVDTIKWYEEIKNVIYVNQSSIWKTPRSCPATFVSIFDKIRDLYAGTTEAKYLWFRSGSFSFNSAKWACPACQWYGYKKVELQFLPDTYVPCELCNSKRYKPEILTIKRRGKGIDEVLDMYISDALDFFSEIDHIKEELQLMVDIGLGYLKMWQPAHTLSWWESQRLKLVKHFLKSYKWHSMYFLDEPTVWLHSADIEKLLLVIKKFLDKWDTILMIEHDEEILKFADDIIRLDDWGLVK